MRVDNQTVTRRQYLSGWRLQCGELRGEGGSVRSTVSGRGGADSKEGLGRKGDAHERRTVRSLKRYQ